MNSTEFKNFKLYTDSTLKKLTKDELIDYIHVLYHNWSCADERAENIKHYAETLNDKLECRAVKTK